MVRISSATSGATVTASSPARALICSASSAGSEPAIRVLGGQTADQHLVRPDVVTSILSRRCVPSTVTVSDRRRPEPCGEVDVDVADAGPA